MPDILHKVRVNRRRRTTSYKALTTCEGLAGWWTTDTTGDNRVGGVVQFRFGGGGFDMEVLELDPGERVRWLVVDGPQEWIGTRIDWELKEDERRHRGDVQAPGLEGAGGVHAPLLDQVGDVPDEPEGADRDRRGRPWPRDVKVDGLH